MQNLRLIARLYITVRKLQPNIENAIDMFQPASLPFVEMALLKMAEGKSKGYLVLISNTVPRCARLILNQFEFNQRQQEAESINKFLQGYKNIDDRIVAPAIRAYDLAKEDKRAPASLPDDSDVETVLSHTEKKLQRVIKQKITKNSFLILRKAALTHLTIFNASRGNECASLSIKRYQDAVDGK